MIFPVSLKSRRVDAAAPRSGRDEMNLAEFPIALLSHRASPETKTLRFEKSITSKNGRQLHQKWVVTSTDAYGLPLAGDEELYLVLLELTRQQDFPKRIYFSRYDLVQRLGWPLKGDSYKRIVDGLLRFKGVQIVAENAFWDKSTGEYAKLASFNIIDDFEIYNEGKRPEKDSQREFPLSWFEWGDRVLQSFRAGNIKQLDLDRFLRLESAISKRLFRFLDKKFGHKEEFAIDVFTLAHEHLGMTRSWKYLSDIKRRLTPALEELCRDGYLESFRYRTGKGKQGTEIVECRKAATEAGPESVSPQSAAAFFYNQLFGQCQESAISSREQEEARKFVDQHGFSAWERFTQFADEYRKTKWPEMTTLGGALRACLHPFLAADSSARADQMRQQHARLKAQWLDYLEAESPRLAETYPARFTLFETTLATDDQWRKLKHDLENPSIRSAQYEAHTRRLLREVRLTALATFFHKDGIAPFALWCTERGVGTVDR